MSYLFHEVTEPCPGTGKHPVDIRHKAGTGYGVQTASPNGGSYRILKNDLGTCPDCGMHWQVKKDGTLRKHKRGTGKIVNMRTGKIV